MKEYILAFKTSHYDKSTYFVTEPDCYGNVEIDRYFDDSEPLCHTFDDWKIGRIQENLRNKLWLEVEL